MTYDNPAFDRDDHDFDWDDDDDEQEVNFNDTFRFQPGEHQPGGLKMQTMQHEKSGMPDKSYLEPPLFKSYIYQDDNQE